MYQVLKQDVLTKKYVAVSIKFNSKEYAENYMYKKLIPEGKPFYLYPYFVGILNEDGTVTC